jgi:hypothetical protein
VKDTRYLRAIGDIDDKLVERAAGKRIVMQITFMPWLKRLAPVAACLAVALVCVWAIPSLFDTPGDTSDDPIISTPLAPIIQGEALTLSQAYNVPVFGAYLPSNVPSTFDFSSAYRVADPDSSYLLASWHSDRDTLSWMVSAPTNWHLERVVSPGDIEKYDMSLYSVPLFESVPEALREIVSNPVFRAEDLTLELVQARVGTGRGGTPSILFSVYYGDVVVEISANGLTPEQVWEMLR